MPGSGEPGYDNWPGSRQPGYGLPARLVLSPLFAAITNRFPAQHPSTPHTSMSLVTGTRGYEIVDFAAIPGTPCPCGSARRAFTDVQDFPGTIHVTEISEDAKLHYHKRLTETYYFLECGGDARMQLDDELLPVHPGMCLLIRPGTRHRAIGRMKVLIVVFPKFDPHDEWLD